jgi:hypothetical protein
MKVVSFVQVKHFDSSTPNAPITNKAKRAAYAWFATGFYGDDR